MHADSPFHRPGRHPMAALSIAALSVMVLPLPACAPPGGDDATPSSGEEVVTEDLVGDDGAVDWNRYYSSAETNRILAEFAALRPGLVELDTIGASYLGKPLVTATVTNRETGPHHEKPALYLDGGLHAGELTGSAVALYVFGQLVNGHGTDPEITELLDRYTFYIRPKFNPDGSDLALLEDQSLRSSVRPWDEDEDGLLDEDPPEDLDGDGWITRMRITDPDGSTRTVQEGIDNDGDGRINEDGIGGLDLNRNFPRNWEPEPIQGGAGPFPLSEPETYAAVEFIGAHPNIVGIVHGHTSGGFVYRLPSASDPTKFPPDDLAVVEELGAEYTRTTGRPVRASSTHPTNHRYGTLISHGYWNGGIIGWVPEYSPGDVWITDYDGDGEISEEEAMRFNEEELGGRYFSDWTPFEHPELGTVEIGGWHSKFWGQNPPAEFLENETAAQVPWILYLVKQAPRLEASGPVVRPAGEGRWEVEVTVTNVGYLPTSLTERGASAIANEARIAAEMEGGGPGGGRGGFGGGRGGPGAGGGPGPSIVPSPVAMLEVDGGEVVDGPARVRMGHLAGTNPHLDDLPERSRTVTWTVEAQPGATIRITISSEKAGTLRLEPVEIG